MLRHVSNVTTTGSPSPYPPTGSGHPKINRCQMLIAVILICSIAATPDLSDCTRENATTVMRVPGESGNPSSCIMQDQAFLAATSVGQEFGSDDRVKNRVPTNERGSTAAIGGYRIVRRSLCDIDVIRRACILYKFARIGFGTRLTCRVSVSPLLGAKRTLC
jgi:hypothetical protein